MLIIEMDSLKGTTKQTNLAVGNYRRPLLLFHPHLETIYPSLLRRIPPPPYRRERIETPDDDFLDLDWLQTRHNRLVIISHGLEGDSSRAYVTGMAHACNRTGWDVLAWNFRGCGGEINRQPRLTHNGATGDLDTVVRHAIKVEGYSQVALVGFSMGGNLSLVYLGRDADMVPQEVLGAISFSVPCDLAGASRRLAEPGNTIYMKRFLRLMGRKVQLQAQRHPQKFPTGGYNQLRTFADFDNRYTAPLHGFRDAEDYWAQCSCVRYLDNIRRPVWIINAQNDPFLSPDCFPNTVNPMVSLLAPSHGGHCGFSRFGKGGSYWSEQITTALLHQLAPSLSQSPAPGDPPLTHSV